MKPNTKEAPAWRHVLLTVLGRNPQPARFTFEGRQADARLGPPPDYYALLLADGTGSADRLAMRHEFGQGDPRIAVVRTGTAKRR